MSLFVDLTCFKEKDQFQVGSGSSDNIAFQQIIDEVESDVLQSMLGCDLYQLMIDDWNAPTVGEFSEARFNAIFNAFCEDDNDCGQRRSDGIVKMLKYFMFFELVQATSNEVGMGGTQRTKTEVMTIVPNAHAGLHLKYNKGIQTYNTIQWKICEESALYPEENGIRKGFMSWL